MAQRVAATLPRIAVPIGHIPQKLKTLSFELENRRGRLYILRHIVNRVIREERAEFKHNRAEEARAYLERLLQMAIFRERDDPYTQEMMRWWLVERDLEDKIYDVLVPRLKDTEQPFTALWTLPPERVLTRCNDKLQQIKYYSRYNIAILEINGNPFPPVLANQRKIEAANPKSFSNQLISTGLKGRIATLKAELAELTREAEQEEAGKNAEGKSSAV